MQQGIMGNVIVFTMGALLILAVLFYLQKARKKAKEETPERDLRYEFYTEPAEGISEDFAEVFGDFLPKETQGVHMVRLSLSNRGRLPVTRTDFSRPIVIVFPSFANVIAARFSEYRGRGQAPEQAKAPHPHGNALEIYPQEIPPSGTVVFDIAVQGTGAPEGVYGHFAGQDRIPRLGENPPDAEPAPLRR